MKEEIGEAGKLFAESQRIRCIENNVKDSGFIVILVMAANIMYGFIVILVMAANIMYGFIVVLVMAPNIIYGSSWYW